MDLFDHKLQKNINMNAPLADRMRPRNLEEYEGQEKIVGPGSLLRRAIESDEAPSMVFWGPPGSGKTTLAKIVANLTGSFFAELSAVAAGKKDLLEIVKDAEERRKMKNKRTILFIDEIHRWNKAQQDALLPFVERGMVILIGATTENPSFEVISALLSRLRVYVLEPLSEQNLKAIIRRALEDRDRGLGKLGINLEPAAEQVLLKYGRGDARVILNALEVAAGSFRGDKQNRINKIDRVEKGDKAGVDKVDRMIITKEIIEEALQHRAIKYDKGGEEHYNVISAFIKSMRGSNADGALYWLARMIEAGEDPKFIARRMVVLASEDIGNADTNALVVANAVFSAVEKIGWPECRINLAQGVVYLCQAPKSNKSYAGIERALKEVKESGALPVPLHLRNAVTGLMKGLGYGDGYKYTHSEDDANQKYLPEEIEGKRFYE